MLFLLSPVPESLFYSPVDKIRNPVWGWLLWNTTHLSSSCPSDVCTFLHFCVRECVCFCGCHIYHRVQKYWFIFKPVFPLINWSGSIFSLVVNCHCYQLMLTDSCLNQMKTERIWWMKLFVWSSIISVIAVTPSHPSLLVKKINMLWWHSQTVHFIISTVCQACRASCMMKCFSDFFIRFQHTAIN